jgi:hypothetical protein
MKTPESATAFRRFFLPPPQKFTIRRCCGRLTSFPAGLISLADFAVAQIVSIALNRRSASPLSRRERIVR